MRFGRTTYGREFRHLMELSPEELRQREAARAQLKYPPVQFTGTQALEIARGFATACSKYGFVICARSILPEHTHLVIARHRYNIERVCIKLKSATTRALVEAGIHPFSKYADPNKRPPRMWSEKQWQAYLDSENAINDAINYVVENPMKEGKPRQVWSFVRPFAGIQYGQISFGD